MSHPLIPELLQLAQWVAQPLDLEVVAVALHTHRQPMVLRVDIRNPKQATGLNDCERMSTALESALDSADIIPNAYVLEVSSPGTNPHLEGDREFAAFRGFMVLATAHTPYEGKSQWKGQLIGRDATHVTLSLRGKIIQIPRSVLQTVELTSK
ncbi:MAG: ribosome maturation factor RimP [Oscillatoriales cyanobacterium SM2_2_1]|nr:ribosome maturation factor RimP [Oscillatoriales cyanobacterium SM2_2_1]